MGLPLLRLPILRLFGTLLFATVLAACQPSDQGPPVGQAPVPTASAPDTSWDQGSILTKNRRFVYLVRWYAPASKEATLDTVVMTATGEPWSVDSTQTVFEWLFREDTTLTYIPSEKVGAIEKAGKFWLHPPRYGRYEILELNPFPDILLPARRGQTWEWEVFPPDDYANPAWATWEGWLTVRHRYRTGDAVLLETPLGRLSCQRVQATGTSKLGTTALESYFHPRYGFVRLHYTNIDGSRTELEMLSVAVRPEPYEKAVEKVFGQTYK